MDDIPVDPQAVTPSWLTQALRSTGLLHQATVTALTAEAIGAIEGGVGVLARFHLTYDIMEEQAPRTLIAKLPVADPVLRARIVQRGHYDKEIQFYEDIAGRIPLRTPKCYYSARNSTAQAYILLLEDLFPARVGNDYVGCSGAEAAEACRALAGFHAYFWEHTALSTMTWIPTFQALASLNQQSYQQSLPLFLDKFSQRVSGFFREIASAFCEVLPNIWYKLGQPPLTMLHGDFRLDNLFFGTEEGGPPFAVVDWQLLRQGLGVVDVAYFLGVSVAPEVRQAREREILQQYHMRLVQHGVQGYTFTQCLRDYQQATCYALYVAVNALAHLDFTSERREAMASVVIARLSAALYDHRVMDLLSTRVLP